ncbi:uncharacterized protein [Amphiura filiformis]|uniref:uncharacterized protein isoform X2 n=1 Tax=Amphiura filiformis TaxID=82378 RepID=UPI003B21B939
MRNALSSSDTSTTTDMRYLRRWAEKMVFVAICIFLLGYTLIYITWDHFDGHQNDDQNSQPNQVINRQQLSVFQKTAFQQKAIESNAEPIQSGPNGVELQQPRLRVAQKRSNDAQEIKPNTDQKQSGPNAEPNQPKPAQQKQPGPNAAPNQPKAAQQKQPGPNAAPNQPKAAQQKQPGANAAPNQPKAAQQKQPGPNAANPPVNPAKPKVAPVANKQNPKTQQKPNGPKKAQAIKLDDSIQISLRPPLLPDFPAAAQRSGNYLNDMVILATATGSFNDFTENWLISIYRLGGSHPKIYIIAEDQEAYDYFHDKKFHKMKQFMDKYVHVIKSPHLEVNSTLIFDSIEYKNFVNKRPQYILDILNKGHDVLFSDVDIVWLHRPYRFFNDPFDIFILEDQGPPSPTVLCAGFVVYKATNATKQFMERWIAEIDIFKEPRPDQVVLNRLFQNKLMIKKPVPNFKYKVLDPNRFVSGHYYFNATWRKQNPQVKPVVLHNNWIKGRDLKVERFKEIDKWYL